jgi:hypothetical protein
MGMDRPVPLAQTCVKPPIRKPQRGKRPLADLLIRKQTRRVSIAITSPKRDALLLSGLTTVRLEKSGLQHGGAILLSVGQEAPLIMRQSGRVFRQPVIFSAPFVPDQHLSITIPPDTHPKTGLALSLFAVHAITYYTIKQLRGRRRDSQAGIADLRLSQILSVVPPPEGSHCSRQGTRSPSARCVPAHPDADRCTGRSAACYPR